MSKKGRTFVITEQVYHNHLRRKSDMKCRQCSIKLKIGDRIHSKSNSNSGSQLKLYCMECAKRLHIV